MNCFYDFLCYDDSFRGEHGDFSGEEAALNVKERVEFLRAYGRALAHKNGAPRQAVDAGALDAALGRCGETVRPQVRERLRLSGLKAFLRPVSSGFAGWQLYAGARIEGDTLVFPDGEIPPVPCAKYCFGGGIRPTVFSCRIFIPKDYLNGEGMRGIRRPPLTTSSGRVIEMRAGIREILRIQIYPNGQAYARVGKPDPYHHRNFLLGEVLTDAWNDLYLALGKDDYTVRWNNGEPCRFELTAGEDPDTIFFSGGMHAVGEWRVQPLLLAFGQREVRSFFEKEAHDFAAEEYLGEKELPFAVGGEACRDRELVLRKSFFPGRGRALLRLRTLDPCGRVLLNGKEVLRTGDFLDRQVDLTSFLRSGENELEICVSPRAPEVLFSWHRHRDPYFGWGCGEALIDFLPGEYLEDMRIETLTVGPGEVRAAFSFGISGFRKNRNYIVELFLQKTNPERGQERRIAVLPAHAGENRIEVSFPAECWSPDAPALYGVRALLSGDGMPLDDLVEETGFRTIAQQNGEIVLNGKKIVLKGALLMQFLPPYDEIVVNHICPSTEQIVRQICAIKAMNGNTVRMHLLGYGTNDPRYARVCDRLGVMNIWTTRLIDSLETVAWGREWRQGEAYLRQIREVFHHPSIIMWEGSNEYHAHPWDIDLLYDNFCRTVRKIDATRLLCPCSHLYYGGGLYGEEGFYYQDDGRSDQDFAPAESSWGWRDPLVVRSAHTYEILLGYGGKWDTFRRTAWPSQPPLFESREHAYLVSEFAVIGRPDPEIPQYRLYAKHDSYELSDEKNAIGCWLGEDGWRESQAYQALCAGHAIKKLRSSGADGILWCCLSGGANDASYLKPIIDFYGYAKYAFYTLREGFADVLCFGDFTDVVAGPSFTVRPVLSGGEEGKSYAVRLSLRDHSGQEIDCRQFQAVPGGGLTRLPAWKPAFPENGYYLIEYAVEEEP